MALNARQQRFVAEYAIDMNATQAAIRAGYSPKRAVVTGSELLRNADVKALVSVTQRKAIERAAEHVEAAVASAAWIVQQAVEVVGEARAAEQYSAANSALALLARRHPEFSEKHEVTGDVRLRVEALAAIATMTHEEMKALAEGMRTNG